MSTSTAEQVDSLVLRLRRAGQFFGPDCDSVRVYRDQIGADVLDELRARRYTVVFDCDISAWVIGWPKD